MGFFLTFNGRILRTICYYRGLILAYCVISVKVTLMDQEVFIYLDDSGTLHDNAAGEFFVYAGYIFLSKKEKDAALAKYRAAVKRLNKTPEKEFKAYGARGKDKRYLISILKEHESFSCVVDKKRVYESIMSSKKSIHRYKDYCIKRATKAKLTDLINRKKIDPNSPIILRFFIDNQPTSTDGIYNLRESIREELSAGIANFDYGTFHRPLFNSGVTVHTKFCDSKTSPLIQASDMLANCIFTKYNYRPTLSHNHANHTEIFLP